MEYRKLMEPGKWYREFDESGVCTAAVYDESYRKLLGYESGEEFAVSPENGTGMIHPDDEARLDALRRDCSARHPEGKDFDIEYRIMTGRGYRLFHDYAHYTRREDGSPIRADGVVFDIQETADREERHQRLTENNACVIALEDNFVSFYEVDPETGEYEMYRRDPADDLGVSARRIKGSGFFEAVLKDIPQTVYPDDRDALTEVLNAGYIREALEKDSHFDYYFRLLAGDAPAWMKLRMVYKDAEKRTIIIGVFRSDNDTEVKQLAEQREKLNEQQKKLQENLDIINALAEEYSAVYSFDVDTAVITSHLIDSESRSVIEQALKKSDRYEDIFASYVENCVYAPDREMMLREGRMENLLAKLADRDTYFITYRGVYGNEVTFCELKYVAARRKNGAIKSFIIGFTHKDAEIMAQYINEKLVSEYISAFLVDLDNDRYRIYRHPDSTSVMEREDRTWSLAMSDFAGECDPEYFELVKNIGMPAFLKKSWRTWTGGNTPTVFRAQASPGDDRSFR